MKRQPTSQQKLPARDKSQTSTPAKILKGSAAPAPLKSQVSTPAKTLKGSATPTPVKTQVSLNKYQYTSSSESEDNKAEPNVESLGEVCNCETCMAKYAKGAYTTIEQGNNYETVACTRTNIECTKADSRSECDCDICVACKTLKGTRDIRSELPKRYAKESAKESVKEPVKEPIKENVKEPRKEYVKEPIKENVKEPRKEYVKEPKKENPKEPTKEPIRDIRKPTEFKSAKESVKDTPKSFSKESVKDTPKSVSKESGKSIMENVMKQMSKEPGKELANDTDKKISDVPCDSGCDKRQFGGIYTYAASGNIGVGTQTLYQEVGVVNFVKQGLDTFKSKAIIGGTTVIDVTMTCNSVVDSSAHTVTSTCIRTDSSGTTINNFQVLTTYGDTGNTISFQYIPNLAYPSPYNIMQVQGTGSR
jgi:hypothetical protein